LPLLTLSTAEIFIENAAEKIAILSALFLFFYA